MEQLIELWNQITNSGAQMWANIGIALIIIVAFIIFSPVFSYIVLKIFNFRKSKEEIKQISFYKPVKLLFILLGIYIAINIFQIPQENMLYINKILKILIIAILAKGFANMANPETRSFKLLQEKINTPQNKHTTAFICKIIKGIIYTIAGFLIITELGYNLNGLAAGLGIGSALIALAAQDFAKNLLGGVTIFLDKAFAIGDFIENGTYQGYVEDITFRSTRIRTLDNTEVNIPNGLLANSYLVNWGNMQKRKIKINLNLDLDIKSETIDRIKEKIMLVLNNHPHVVKDSVYIICNEISGGGIELFIYLFVDIVKYDKYMLQKSEINEIILELLAKENVKLSYTGQKVVLKN